MLQKIKGQTILEYAILIAVVAGAMLAINIYMKRGVEGKLRESTDTIGAQFDASNTSVYSKSTVQGSSVTEQKILDGETTTGTSGSTSDYSNETVAGFENFLVPRRRGGN